VTKYVVAGTVGDIELNLLHVSFREFEQNCPTGAAHKNRFILFRKGIKTDFARGK
jgi:hypothetical protein